MDIPSGAAKSKMLGRDRRRAKLLVMSGDKKTYPDDPIGITDVGAYADLLIVDGEPLEDIIVLGDVDNLRLIMTDGTICKNTIE